MLIPIVFIVGLILVFNYLPSESITKGTMLVICITWILAMLGNPNIKFDFEDDEPKKKR